MPDLVQYMWIVWLVFIVICVIIEVLTLEFIFLMVAIGSVGGLGTQLAGGPWWLQIIVAMALALLLLFVIRPVLLRATRRGADPTPSNLDALTGMGGRVLIELGDHGGQVKLANGETWTARLADSLLIEPVVPLAIGTRVSVNSISGSTAIVVPATAAASWTASEPVPKPGISNSANPNESSAAS